MTLMLTGMWPMILLVATVLTAMTSALLLWLFKRRTLASMQQHASAPLPAEKAQTQQPHRVAATENNVQASTSPTPLIDSESIYHEANRSLRAIACVYATGGLVYAVILAIPWMINAGGGFFIGRFTWLVAAYAWPAVLAIIMVTAMGRGDRLKIAAAYFTGIAVIAGYVLFLSPDLTIPELVVFWFITNGPGTMLLLAFLHRRVRAVGPLVLGFMVAGVTGAFLLNHAALNNDWILGGIAAVGDTLGLAGTLQIVLLYTTGFVVFGGAGWWLLRLTGRLYRAKALSDQSLIMDSMWLLFAVVQPILLAFDGWAWIFTGLVAFTAYKLVTLAGFGLLRRKTGTGGDRPALLLLRVFALGSRSERFFDVFSKTWRLWSSISLIAGPDLVTTVVKPHEFLDFVSGRLSRQFVTGEDDLRQRIAVLDRQADPDGRFRVNEFFCHADTWQMTMRRLAEHSSVVLMDLRSFSPENQGCLYELQQLVNLVDLKCVVFLVDDTTDHKFLDEKLEHALQNAVPESLNHGLAIPSLRIYYAKNHSRQTVKELQIMALNTQSGPGGFSAFANTSG